MINTIDFGKHIYSILTGNAELMAKVTKVSPCVADNDTKFPFIVYQRVGLTSNSCKDGYYEDNVVVKIAVVADSYSDSIQIANLVRALMEMFNERTVEGMSINESALTQATEKYANNAYVQELQFTLKITQ